MSFHNCEVCGNSFEFISDGHSRPNKTCSKVCRYSLAASKFGPKLKVFYEQRPKIDNKVKKICLYCKEIFMVWPYRAEISQFCSTICKAKSQIGWGARQPEKLERMKEKVSKAMISLTKDPEFMAKMQKGLHLKMNRLEGSILNVLPHCVHFTGDRKFRVEFLDGHSKFPDFTVEPITLTKKVIEAASTYWHSKEEMEKVVQKYREVGYECLVVWEKEFFSDVAGWSRKLVDFVHNHKVLLKVLPDGKKPTRAHITDAGQDLYSRVDVVLPANLGTPTFIPCGIQMFIPPECKVMIYGRSGLATKGLLCHVGTVDADYIGELGPLLFNLSGRPYEIKKGDRVGQMVLAYTKPRPIEFQIEEVNELPITTRGNKGFGSSGR